MSPYAERLRPVAIHAPWLLATLYGLVLLWPIPSGRMPLSADHTVHLTRIWMFASELASANLRGWSAIWFFGAPVGELYPVLGDLLIVAIRALSLGLLSWPQAYALGLTVVFIGQGWAMLRVSRAMGLGPFPGLVAAFLVMSDAGAYREGGWEYTMLYGVWPQTLATSLTWLALGEIALAAQAEDIRVRCRRTASAALAVGAALLAHPMSLMAIALGGPLLVVMLGMWSRPRLERATTVGVASAVLGLALAAWWLVPMFEHRAWMASYGWLWLPLERMLHHATKGELAQNVPVAVTVAFALGALALALRGARFARFVAVYAIALWFLASQDVVWALRLDRLSEGFTHIQYQRFITLAKPGIFLVAGAAVGMAFDLGQHLWRGARSTRARALAGSSLAIALGLVGWLASDQSRIMQARQVGQVQLVRAPNTPQLDDDYAALLEWMRDRWDERTRFYRATVHEARNAHWFMDAPVFSSMPLYKQGFTPGDNFVHKPETGAPALLDRLQVRYVISLRRSSWRDAEPVTTFGAITVFERHGWDERDVAWLEGPGQLEVLEENLEQGLVRVRVQDSGGATRLVFGIAGYPRWQLEDADGALEWFEAPVVGDGPSATVQERRQGVLRGGKAHGNDGSEPTLIASDVGDGVYTLRYRASRGRDVLALSLTVIALALCVLCRWPWRMASIDASVMRSFRAVERRFRAVAHPLVLAACVAAVMGALAWKQHRGIRSESERAFGWLLEGRANASRVRPGFLKTDMLIRPAIRVASRSTSRPAVVELPGVVLEDVLHGWVAIDDDAAKVRGRGHHRLRIEARPTGVATGEAWNVLTEFAVPHAPGRRSLELATDALHRQKVDLRIVVTSTGESPPPLGFDLELGGPA